MDHKIFFTLLSLLINFSINAQQTVDEKVKVLLSKMTIQEKIGQMNQYNGFWNFTGPTPDEGDQKAVSYTHLRAHET